MERPTSAPGCCSARPSASASEAPGERGVAAVAGARKSNTLPLVMDAPAGPAAAPTPRPAETRAPGWGLAALVTGLVFCLVPFAGVIPATLGALSLRLAARSGAGRGASVALAGLLMGALNLLASAGVAGALLLNDSGASAGPKVASGPVAMAPPSAGLAAAPPAGRPLGADEGGQMTTVNEVVETQAGSITLVDIPPSLRSFEAELDAQRDKARLGHQKLVLFTITEECRPCLGLAAGLVDPRMQLALDHVRLLRVDIHDVGQELTDLGVDTRKIPGLYLLGPNLSPTDGITGAEWDDDTADNAAPVIGAFVRGSYRKRRERYVPLPRSPAAGRSVAPPPTML